VTVATTPVSRPLRAFVVVVGGWTLMRVLVLWHASDGIAVPLVEAQTALRPTIRVAHVLKHKGRPAFILPVQKNLSANWVSADHPRIVYFGTPMPIALPPRTGTTTKVNPDVHFVAPLFPVNATTNRFSGSAWALLRPGGSATNIGAGGTLGGSQVGARLFYEPGPQGLALTARLSAPVATRMGREASVGVGVRGRLVGLLLERRIALDRGARNAMSLTAYGGIYDVALPHGFRMEGYAQFGIVGARRRDGFADGALRISRSLMPVGQTRLSLGAALSGGAQPGVARVDLGPELTGDVPVGGKTVRLAIGWRERVAGNAAPGSGPSLSIGFGF
jgi:hypothetical protein